LDSGHQEEHEPHVHAHDHVADFDEPRSGHNPSTLRADEVAATFKAKLGVSG
jgi:hypothetical protein